MCSAECKLWSVKRMQSAQCGLWSVLRIVWNVALECMSVEVYSVGRNSVKN